MASICRRLEAGTLRPGDQFSPCHPDGTPSVFPCEATSVQDRKVTATCASPQGNIQKIFKNCVGAPITASQK